MLLVASPHIRLPNYCLICSCFSFQSLVLFSSANPNFNCIALGRTIFSIVKSSSRVNPSRKYSNGRTTRSSNIEYYVKPEFHPPKNKAEFEKFESTVVDEYVSDLRHQCQREHEYKESMLWRARMMNDKDQYHRTQQQATPSCTKLTDFVRTGRA